MISQSWKDEPFEAQSVDRLFSGPADIDSDEPRQVLEKLHRFEKERSETFVDLLEAGEIKAK